MHPPSPRLGTLAKWVRGCGESGTHPRPLAAKGRCVNSLSTWSPLLRVGRCRATCRRKPPTSARVRIRLRRAGRPRRRGADGAEEALLCIAPVPCDVRRGPALRPYSAAMAIVICAASLLVKVRRRWEQQQVARTAGRKRKRGRQRKKARAVNVTPRGTPNPVPSGWNADHVERRRRRRSD